MNDQNPELQLSEEFVRDTCCNIFLTGKAGTGKTTFLHNLKSSCAKRMIITAPTGVAAINAGGVTLHSFFQMPFGPFIPGSENSRQHKFNKEKINLIKSLDLLVIDEISMVRADLLDGVDSVLRRYRRSTLPFGGVQLLFIGDLHQLPPVVKQNEWGLLQPYYSSPYFFSSLALARTELITIELQHIYRQEDGSFIELLNRVRGNSIDTDTLDTLNSRYRKNIGESVVDNEGYITLCSHNAGADNINETKLKQLSSKSVFFKAEIEGEFPDHSFPTTPALELKIGAQVMFVRNDSSYEKRYFNGKIGKVISISGDSIRIECPGDDDYIFVEPATWENIEYTLNHESMEITENKIGAFTQLPLKLAWAITIHKSQGLTFDRAIIDAQAAFAHGQVYVALSRCRTFEGMVLSSPLTHNSIRTDKTVLQFNLQAASKLPTSEKLGREKASYEQRLILDCFDFGKLQNLFGRLLSFTGKNKELIHIVGVKNLPEAHKSATEHIFRVGGNFINQLQGLFKEDQRPSTDPAIKERLQKASSYFQEKMTAGLNSFIPHLLVETDSKELRKQGKKLIKTLQEEHAVKSAAVNYCENGFEVSGYLRAISTAEIEAIPKKVKSQAIVYIESDIAHPELFNQLKEWRKKKAKDDNVAHFQVLHQKTMIQIVVNLPDTIPSLIEIRGIGKKLAEKYGDELVKMVQEYREKHNIKEVHLPEIESRVVNEIPQKPTFQGDTKQISLELLNKGRTINEIAKERGLTQATIEGHIAYFIGTGEIEVTTFVEKDRVGVIEKTIGSLETNRLKEIKDKLGEEYSYAEIKFVQAHLENLKLK